MSSVIEKLSNMRDSELKAIYLMYREGDDTYSFYQIRDEFERRDKEKLWGKFP